GATIALPLLARVAIAATTKPAGSTSSWPPAQEPQPAMPAITTTATGSILHTAGTLPDYFLGLSYEKVEFSGEPLFTPTNTSLAGLFNLLGNGVLAIGGNSMDQTIWMPDGPGNTPGQVSPADIDNLAGFLALTGWKLIYGLNLATSTPELAAAEAAYAQASLGNVLLAFQIGNEPDEYSLSYFPVGWNLASYETVWEEFRTAVVDAVPGAMFAGPSCGGNETTWTVPFISGPGGKQIALVTQHYYRGNGHSATATAKNLVSNDTTIVADCTALRFATGGMSLPFRFSETNSYLYGGAPGVSNAYASALWVIDHLFRIALGGGSGVNMQGGDQGYYTPIANSGGTVIGAMPEYYGLLLVSLIGPGTLLSTQLSTVALNITMYAVVTASGQTNIVIVNKELYQYVKLTIKCPQIIKSAELIELQGDALTALTGQTLQGATVGTDGSFAMGAPYTAPNVSSYWVTCYVPAISAILLRVS
ncbi:MAG: hypothetical protein WA510_18145, partial [Acidobacteriaceae bacterium]